MRKHHVLIVCGDAANANTLKGILSGIADGIVAAPGSEAKAALKEHRDALCAVLIDTDAPVSGGCATLAALREDSSLPHFPVIVTSAAATAKDEEAAFALGANDFIAKPYTTAVLLRRVKNLIDLFEADERIAMIENDPLTDIFHKDAFFLRAEERLATDTATNYMLVATDIEHFKLINDSYGNDEGDKILIALAHKIREISHSRGGICGRFGSDQFVALAPYISNEEFIESSEAIIPQLAACAPDIKLTVKTGVYIITRREMSISAMCDRALLAANSIKGQYGKSVAFYDDEIRRKMQFEQRMTLEMNSALANGEFEVYLQPKYDLASEHIAGAEALVRWNHPELGLISPGEFIPLFEHNGFITELDKFVWNETCGLIEQWIRDGGKYVPVSVNVSRRDIYSENLPKLLTEITASHGMRPNQLHLEITETAYTETPEQLIDVVAKLKKLGFIIEMDDFGSGYSSLNMLSELPIDILKLDMRFIQKQSCSNSSRNILSFIISLAKWMDLLVVAEGVETQEQIDLLRTMDCNYVQGYYYAKPMPAAQFTDILLNSELADPIVVVRGANKAEVHENVSGKIMLIVDDVQINRETLASFFSNLYTIAQADNGLTAYEYIQENFDRISVIMLDLIMPVMDGYELLKRLRQNRLYSDIPVVVTSQAGGASEMRAFELGANDYIAKPYNMEIALHRVQNVTMRNAVQMFEREKHMLDRMRRLAAEAKMDSMTGLCNRAELENQIDTFVQTKGDAAKGVFIIIDIDNFKLVNDRLGHTRGDAAIRKLADILRGHFRENDVLCRMGGDEFAVFMKADLNPQQLSLRLAALCSKLNYYIDEMPLTCSVGACVMPDFGKGYEQLYQNADLALLSSKRLGKNQYQVYGGTADLPVYAFVRNVDWLLDEMSDAMYVCDTEDYKLLYINKVASDKVGLSKKECLGRPCHEVFFGRSTPCEFCYPSDKLSESFSTTVQKNRYGLVTTRIKLLNWGGKPARIHYVQTDEEAAQNEK